jgi:glycine C-acetyltransferase
VDLFDRIRTNEEPLSKMARQLHGYFTYPKLEGPLGAHMKFRGKDILNWNVNDYLGFTQNGDIRSIDEELTRKWGLSYPSGNRIMAGHTGTHEKLESMLADFVHKEDAFVLNYGYQGITSVIDALCDRNDIIIYDIQVHASMIDGIRLHRGEHFSYQHNDMDSLENALKKAESKLGKNPKGGILLLTQGVFSSTGDYGKLDEIVALKRALLIQDFTQRCRRFWYSGEKWCRNRRTFWCQHTN